MGYPAKGELGKPAKRNPLYKLVFFEKYKNKMGAPPKRLVDIVKKGISKLKKPR